jgi:hypothetical protein
MYRLAVALRPTAETPGEAVEKRAESFEHRACRENHFYPAATATAPVITYSRNDKRGRRRTPPARNSHDTS